MTLDGYAYCPCGSGKKIKFCCSKDIMADLDRVTRALDGDQRQAALDLLDRTIIAHGPRPALLALKCTTQLQTGDLQGTAETVAALNRQQPDSTVASAAAAILAVGEGDAKAAATHLQSALDHGTEAMHSIVYEAMGLAGRALVAAGHLAPGLAYLVLQLSISQGRESQVAEIVTRLHSTNDVPLVLKGWNAPGALKPANEGSGWESQFEEARRMANRGAWGLATAQLESAAQSRGDDPILLKNLAILKSWLDDGASEAWRRYAACPGIALDDAVEAEAIAQLLDPARDQRLVDVVRVTQPVTDAGQVLERMLSDRRFVSDAIGPSWPADEPPPKAILSLLDRPLPASCANLAIGDVPNVLGALFLYGRQTDREACFELISRRTGDLAAAKAVLGEILADLSKEPASEEVVDRIPEVNVALSLNWRLPADTTPDVEARLTAEHAKVAIFERWPDLPMPSLDEKTPRGAAADPSMHVRLLAAILLIELTTTADGTELDFNELRRNLGLPTRQPIDPAAVDVRDVSLAQFPLMITAKLSDDDLLYCYERADHFGVVSAIRPLAREALSRPHLGERIDRAAAHYWLARTAKELAEATEHLQAARQAARAQGQSPAPWLLAELALQLQHHNLDRCEEIFQELRTAHIREPGVRESLLAIFNRFGLVDESGRPAVGQAPSAVEATGEPAAAASQLWTPDQAGSASGQKSKLWVPGSE